MKFIAEIGLNHNGNFGLIFELVKRAALADADIAKFQLGWRAAKGEINKITETELQLIFDICSNFNIEPMFSIINPEALQLLDQFSIGKYKIASRTVIEFPDMVKQIIERGKRTYISLGMWPESHRPFGNAENIDYLWCKSSYPAYPWDLTDMPKDFQKEGYAGYSDHSVGLDVPLMAITRGAQVIEKHFTLDKSDTTIRDHALSATPDEFATMVQIGRQIRRNLDLGV